MNQNQPDPDPTPNADLVRAGAAVRAEAGRHPGDLRDLVQRSNARKTRVRAAGAGLGVFALLALGTVVVAHGTHNGDVTIEQGAAGPGGSTSVPPATDPGTITEPMWTVNPSIPLSADQEIWALEIVYDPAIWDFQKLLEEPAFARVPGLAGFHREPRAEAYWVGASAQGSALAAQAAIQDKPGIVSAEVGRARATRSLPKETIPGSIP